MPGICLSHVGEWGVGYLARGYFHERTTESPEKRRIGGEQKNQNDNVLLLPIENLKDEGFVKMTNLTKYKEKENERDNFTATYWG